MHQIKNKFFIFHFLIIFAVLPGCKKYLDLQPSANLEVPKSLDDLQAVLDYVDNMNRSSCYGLEWGSDDYYLLDDGWESLPIDSYKWIYIWDRKVFSDERFPGHWLTTYAPVFRSNLVLENIINIPLTLHNSDEWKNVKGSAYLFRARSLFEAALVWAKVYDSVTAKTDLGIPVRLSTDFNIKTTRETMDETFTQIVSDLKNAAGLLKDLPSHPYRPSKAGAYGLLARTFLYMGRYSEALLYADSCLHIKNDLIDYNEISSSLSYPFALFNEETIFYTEISGTTNITRGRIDTVLYASYDTNDLRRDLFFKVYSASSGGGMGFRGNYSGRSVTFNGVAVDEMYLIRAECFAREGDVEKALADLNYLLSKRFKSGTYTPYSTNNKDVALLTILSERRKELIFRGLRWSDLKRLNREPRFARTIKRVLNGVVYELPPNDGRYAMSIPNEVIEMTKISQND